MELAVVDVTLRAEQARALRDFLLRTLDCAPNCTGRLGKALWNTLDQIEEQLIYDDHGDE